MVDTVTSALGAGQNSQSSSAAGLASNFEMFLTLLTEQLKNQDPLSPLDSNEFVNQLVQFSSVEQQINQTDALNALVNLQVASVGGATVSYLGKEIRVASPENQLTQAGASWAYSIEGEEAPRSVNLTVTDAEGKVVYSAEGSVEPGEHGFYWDGLDNQGEPLPLGTYALEVAAVSENAEALPVSIASFGLVTGIDLSGSEPVLLLGSAQAPFSLVQAVREPVQAQTFDETETEQDGGA